MSDPRNEHPCAKQQVVAVAVVGGIRCIGENWCANQVFECPRKDMPSGVGYDLCKEVCGQQAHAEVDLINKVGGDLRGADVHVYGHTYVCKDCLAALKKANAGNVYVAQEMDG